MERKRKIAIAVAVPALLLLFMGTVLPLIVKAKAVEAIGEATGRAAKIGALSINPFTLTMTVNDLRVEEKGRAPLVTFATLRTSLSAASLWRRALVLGEITLERPRISFARTAPNRYSFSDIIDRQLKKKGGQEDEGGRFLFSLNNIVIRDGSIDFFDEALGTGRTHTVRKLEVGIPFISNIPYYADSYVVPRVAAVVNGTPFVLSGKTKPLSRSLETSLHLGVRRLDLLRYVGYSPVAPPVEVRSGLLSVDTELSYRVSLDRKPEVALSGGITLEDAQVALKNGKPLLKLPLLDLKGAKLDLTKKRYALSSLTLDGLELFVSRDRRGEWMYSHLLPKKTERAAEDAEAEAAEAEGAKSRKEPQPFELSSFILKNGALHFSDQVPREGFSTEVSKIEAAVNGFSSTGAAPASYQLSFSIDQKGSAESAGSFTPSSASFAGKVALRDLEIGRSWPYLSERLTAPVSGTADASADLAYTPEAGLSASGGTVVLHNLSTRYGGDRLLLGRLAAVGAAYRAKLNNLDVGEISLSRGSVSVSREEDGSLSVLALVRDDPRKARPAGLPRGKEEGSVPPFSYRLGKIDCSGLKLSFTDKTREGDPVFTLNNTRLTVANVTGPRFRTAGIHFGSTFGTNAALAADGVIAAAPFSYTGTVKVARLPLRDFEAYLPDNLNVFVVGGLFDADLKLSLALRDGKPMGSFRGNAGVRDFYSMDSVAEQDLLKWESLQFDGIRGELYPFALNIDQIALNNLYSRIVVRPDGTLNLQNLMAKEEPAAGDAQGAAQGGNDRAASAGAPAASAAAAPAPVTAPRKIAIGAVTVQEGTVAFTDEHLPQTFSTTFYHLGGRVTGLSSDEQKSAEVDLRGNLENRSPLQITGRINPLREDLLVDLKISFRDIELPGVSPYSGTYLGYRVDKGKLFLDLKYLIEKKQLKSENRVFIDQFTFGEKVESPKATNLPVRLAVAMIKDKNGEIHLDLPVTGRTDDPQVSIWGLVWQVVRNVFVKAATSPLGLISSMFGGGSDLSCVTFGAGASSLSPAEAQKLQKLAKALSDRPGIRLEVAGFIDRERDPEGYRLELLKKKVKGEKFLQLAKEKRLAPGQTAESLEVGAEEYPKLLKAVYQKEKFPKPRTMVGTLKALPEAEMTKLILANTTVGEDQLRALAHERCAAVTTYLVGEGKLPQERVFEKSGDIYATAKKEGAGGRVEFGVVAN